MISVQSPDGTGGCVLAHLGGVFTKEPPFYRQRLSGGEQGPARAHRSDARRPGVPLPYGDGQNRKGIMVAPAMNTAMWNHPVTKRHLDVLETEWDVAKGGWVEVLRPVEKELACGDIGGGAMRDWQEIVKAIEERTGLSGTPTSEGGSS